MSHLLGKRLKIGRSARCGSQRRSKQNPGRKAMRATKITLLAAVAFALGLGACAAQAQEKFPDHPINFIVPWGPGGGADLLARTAGKIMSEDLGVSVPVINVPGATGATGMTK